MCGTLMKPVKCERYKKYLENYQFLLHRLSFSNSRKKFIVD